MVREIRERGEEIDAAAVDRDVDERLQTLTQMIEHSESDAHRLVDETSSVTFPGTKRGRKKAIFSLPKKRRSSVIASGNAVGKK